MCKTVVVKGEGLLKYSFPAPHPFNSSRPTRFWEYLSSLGLSEVYAQPVLAGDDEVRLFHSKDHLEFVRKASDLGYGFLDEGDTPAYKGVLEAAEIVVGSTLSILRQIVDGKADHGFNPVGGLHHARKDRSAGFCVFNDVGVAIERLRSMGLERILYVDIDVHHGDGVFYPYEEDPGVFIFDVHEDGHFLYPGTGRAEETGKGPAMGSKVNIPLLPGEGDERSKDILPKLETFATKAKPDFIIFQAGADGLAGDPLGGLRYSQVFHRSVAALLHKVSHDVCGGRMIVLGGGGYDVENCAKAWSAVVKEMASGLPFIGL